MSTDAMRDIDREISDALRMVQSIPRGMRRSRGMGRSMRAGSNHMRRMRPGQMVSEHRRNIVHQEQGLERSSSEALAVELERRGLKCSAAEVRRGPADQAGQAVATTTMGAAAAGIMASTPSENTTEDSEAEQLEAAVDERVEELAGDELESLPVETERETTMLTANEMRDDLEEIGAPAEAMDAHDYAADVVGDNPQEGFEAGVESHPETLEFAPLQVEQTSTPAAEL